MASYAGDPQPSGYAPGTNYKHKKLETTICIIYNYIRLAYKEYRNWTCTEQFVHWMKSLTCIINIQ